jgi:hypothetical protein
MSGREYESQISELLRGLEGISCVWQKTCYPNGLHTILYTVLNPPGLPVPGFYIYTLQIRHTERSIGSYK